MALNPKLLAHWRAYLPDSLRDTAPDQPEGTDLFVWRDDRDLDGSPYPSGAVYAIAFAGKMLRPLFNYRFKSAADRERFIDEKIAARRSKIAAKVAKREARKAETHSLAVGDVLYSSWGYDQTNVDYYQVVAVPGPKSVVIREIAKCSARNGSGVVPFLNRFVGAPMLKRASRDGYVRLNSFSCASKWDGAPKYDTHAAGEPGH